MSNYLLYSFYINFFLLENCHSKCGSCTDFNTCSSCGVNRNPSNCDVCLLGYYESLDFECLSTIFRICFIFYELFFLLECNDNCKSCEGDSITCTSCSEDMVFDPINYKCTCTENFFLNEFT